MNTFSDTAVHWRGVLGAAFRAVRRAMLPGACVAAAALISTGCPTEKPAPVNGAKLSLLLSASGLTDTAKAGADGDAKARVVQPSEITGVLVTIEEIQLVEQNSGPVSVFTGPVQADLLALSATSQVLDSAVVPEGTYTEARLILSNALLEFASAPGTLVDSVGLLDEGLLSVAVNFSAAQGGGGILLLDLSTLSIAELEDGTYQMLPDLRVDLFDTSVEAQAQGRIAGLDLAQSTFTLTGSTGSIAVNFADADIFRESDFDVPTGTPADLANGFRAFAFGTVGIDGSLVAETVVILDDSSLNGEDSFILPLNGTSSTPAAHGKVEYENESSHDKLEFEAEDLPLISEVSVVIDGTMVAVVPLVGDDVRFTRDSRLGESVPVVTRNSVIEVFNTASGALLMVNQPGVVIEDDDGDDRDDDGSNSGRDDDDDGDDDHSGSGGDDDDDDRSGPGGDSDDSDDDSGDDSGGDDNGGDDSGSDDGSGDDNGGDNSGSDDEPGDDNGGDDSGSDDDDDDRSGHGGGDDDDEDDDDDNEDDDDKM